MAKYDPTLPPVPAPEAGLPNPIQPPSANPPELGKVNPGKDADAEDGEEAAYERGAEAGKSESAANKNPYPEDSSRAKAFDHGYLDAQKIRSDDKPPH